jgi:hypothetical protein
MAIAIRAAETGAMPMVMVWWMRRIVGAKRRGAGAAVRSVLNGRGFRMSAIVAKKAGHWKR